MSDLGVIPPHTLSIAAVERDTGLSKDTLRVWERRYGFPAPLRDAGGERAYPLEQIDKLRLVKRLIDAGHRPGRIVAMPLAQLQGLAEGDLAGGRSVGATGGDALATYLEQLKAHEVTGLRRQLGQACMRMGLARFVTELVAPLNTRVGEAWMRGQLAVFEEHVYTECVQDVLRGAIARLPEVDPSARPRVLLTTFPGEPHGLGLLMAQALLALDGAACLSLGVGTPVWDIALAANAYRCDIVALSFTGCMNPNQVVEGLTELRSKLVPQVELWAGGAQPALHRRPVPGVRAIAALDDAHDALRRWRDPPDPGARP
jgi:methanogenic corrinoid protein MtbC1